MKIIKLTNTILSGILALSIAGCASIVDGGRKTVSIKSQPSEAKVTVYDKKGTAVVAGNTPALFPLKRSGGFFVPVRYRILIEKEGYQTAELEVKSTVNGWYFGNVLFGGLLGLLIVDPATGAMWTLNPKDINSVLEQKSASVLHENEGLVVILRQDVPEPFARSLQALNGVK